MPGTSVLNLSLWNYRILRRYNFEILVFLLSCYCYGNEHLAFQNAGSCVMIWSIVRLRIRIRRSASNYGGFCSPSNTLARLLFSDALCLAASCKVEICSKHGHDEAFSPYFHSFIHSVNPKRDANVETRTSDFSSPMQHQFRKQG